MAQIVHVLLLVLVGCVVLFLLLVAVIDMTSRVEWLHHRFPHLRRLGTHKPTYSTLLLVTLGLLLFDIAETWKWQAVQPAPRVVNGAEPYKNIPTAGLAQMIDAEIDKIDDDQRLCDTSFVPLGPSQGHPAIMNELAKSGFAKPFLQKDLPNLIDLDNEAAKRLGPGVHDGPSLLEMLSKIDPLHNNPEDVCQDVLLLLPYFKRTSAALRLQAASSP
jgi:hypothetical protein